MQTWGLARAFGATVREWPLVEDGAGGWRVDLAALERLVSPRTKLIVICNPNNPTGARFDAADLDAIAAIAERHGAGSCPTRSTAAPSSTAARRRRCGAGTIG